MKRDRHKKFWVEIPQSIIPQLWAAAALANLTPDELVYSGIRIISALTLEKSPRKPQRNKPPEREDLPCHVAQTVKHIASKFAFPKQRKTASSNSPERPRSA